MKVSPYVEIKRIEFVVTYQCSGHCKHCSVGEELNRPTSFPHVRVEEAVKAIDWLGAHFPVSSIMTFGGEPLLHAQVTAALHQRATHGGIPSRQLITNGYFSKDQGRIQEVARLLAQSGVTDLLISVDAFHQETIPLEPVRQFVGACQEAGLPHMRLQPAWVVDRNQENSYNAKTEEILSHLDDLGIPTGAGNGITLAGNAVKFLSEFYPPPQLNPADTCGTMLYTEPLDQITSLSIIPNGDVKVCGFVIGNIYREEMADIVSRYQPGDNIYMNAILTGRLTALVAAAQENGISVDCSKCYSICDVCHKILRNL